MDCKKYNTFFMRFFETIFNSNRKQGVAMIKEKGIEEFATFMADKDWVTIKRRQKKKAMAD